MFRRLTALACVLAPALAFGQDFRLAMLDIGQGDSMVVVSPSGCAALLDGGPTGSGTTIKAALKAMGVTRLDFAVASHYHADHIGGIDEVDVGTDAVAIDRVYDRGGTYASATFDAYASHFAGKRSTVAVGQTFSLCGEVTFRVVASDANGVSSTDENAHSVVVKLSYGEFDALVGGDLTGYTPDIESLIAPSVGEVELYKVHHHGSRTASNDTLLAAMRPIVSLISLGYNNTYGHPHAEALARLAAVGTEVWQTEDPATAQKLGHIQVDSATGASFTVSQGQVVHSYTSKGGGVSDTTAPSVPSGLVASTRGSDAVDLAWSAAQDDTGVSGYRVYRSLDGSIFQLAGTTTSTTYTDTGLTAGTTYHYAVGAFDAAGNESAPSPAATATTAAADTQAPSAPTGLVATALSTSEVALSWSPASDDVGVTAYRVFRDGFAVSDAVGTDFTDTGRAADTTYRYEVVAMDGAGNVSAPSASATVTTPCGVSVSSLTYKRGSLTVRATCTQAPGASLALSADGQPVGPMTYVPKSGAYELTAPLASQPACVQVSASCGGTATRCF